MLPISAILTAKLRYIFFQNILLEEVNTNAVKWHISQNDNEEHAFTVNMHWNGGSRHKSILALFVLLLNQPSDNYFVKYLISRFLFSLVKGIN